MQLSNPALLALVAQHSFLDVVNSRDLYPHASGTGLPLLVVNTAACRAVIALQGAQLLEFTPTNSAPLLWLSPNCDFTPSTAIRGGVPVCLPWFGVNRTDPNKPKHGFARNLPWTLISAAQLDDGQCEILFEFISAANDLFAHTFSAQLRLTLGAQAALALSVTNTDTQSFECSWALHSYHPVRSLSKTRVLGLAGREYLDNLAGYERKLQQGDLAFAGEVDRVYPGIENPLTIHGTPTITITQKNCPSVITWNPGAVKAARISDLGAGQEQHYICVERGAVLAEAWQLRTGETKTASLTFGHTAA